MVHEISEVNNLGLDDLLDDDNVVDIYADDVVITYSRKSGFVKPAQYNSDSLVKRENDPVSGNKAYTDSVIICFWFRSRFFLVQFHVNI